MGSGLSTTVLNNALNNRKKFSHFSEKELKKWEVQFQQQYPAGYITEKDMISIFLKLFPFGKFKFASLLFRTINISNSGEIDFSELLIAFSILRKGSLHEKLRWLFRLYDTDSDGVISKDEMETVVQSFMDMVRPSLFTQIDSSTSESTIDSMNSDQNDNHFNVSKFVNDIFRESENESGFLSYDDFKSLAQRRSVVLNMFELFD